MSKVLTIDRCTECPYSSVDAENAPFCEKLNRYMLFVGWEKFPSWCPLPEAEEAQR